MRGAIPGAVVAAASLAALGAAGSAGAPARSDGAVRVPVAGLAGSLQNPCFAPDGARLVLTRWRGGYNAGELADVWVVPRAGGAPEARLSAGEGVAVNLPGTCWNAATDRIVFVEELDGPEQVFTTRPDGSERAQVTRLPGFAVFEASLSPDGQRIVFERHRAGADDPGQIWVVRADGTGLRRLTRGSDDRQPNWSPAGDRIAFQRRRGDTWDVWTVSAAGGPARNLTRTPELSETDVSWSPSGRFLVFSSDGDDVDVASLFTIAATGARPRRLTRAAGYYDGAPSWSPDGRTIAFESRRGEPDGSRGTTIWTIPAPGGRR